MQRNTMPAFCLLKKMYYRKIQNFYLLVTKQMTTEQQIIKYIIIQQGKF